MEQTHHRRSLLSGRALHDRREDGRGEAGSALGTGEEGVEVEKLQEEGHIGSGGLLRSVCEGTWVSGSVRGREDRFADLRGADGHGHASLDFRLFLGADGLDSELVGPFVFLCIRNGTLVSFPVEPGWFKSRVSTHLEDAEEFRELFDGREKARLGGDGALLILVERGRTGLIAFDTLLCAANPADIRSPSKG